MKILNESFNKKMINKPNQTSKLHFFLINQILKDHHCSDTLYMKKYYELTVNFFFVKKSDFD